MSKVVKIDASVLAARQQRRAPPRFGAPVVKGRAVRTFAAERELTRAWRKILEHAGLRC